MMRPMKLAGEQLIFGSGCLEHLKTLNGSRALIVTGGSSMKKSGVLQTVIDYLEEAGMKSEVFAGVEPDPSFRTVFNGAEAMKKFQPDVIIGLGGGSAMDAAKAMRIYYEYPELTTLQDILPPNPFPKLGRKAYVVCIPSTSGTASEVSRSVVITDNETNVKYGIGNMEMVPEVAICDPVVTATMPPKITAETGMDALTHALEALVSRRSNYLSSMMAATAARDIIHVLPKAYEHGESLEYREIMLNASFTAGLAFTNVSLGIVHSMAHALGSLFSLPHGLANAILLPYVMRFNYADQRAKAIYHGLAEEAGVRDLMAAVCELNERLGIPAQLREVIADESKFSEEIPVLAELALNDGCTKTNPVIPSLDELKELFRRAYSGN
ncbi:MAG: iron-containing alcohol dehydrogenase [Bacillota bacterium]|jgi:alcohol dehydrogenase class IV|nr:iron-containing alcohol dehydrogenase [Bacillota bacterium]